LIFAQCSERAERGVLPDLAIGRGRLVEIAGFLVAAPHRRRGIGTALVRRVIGIARGEDARVLS
jgi:GNAT superfamily N-acetyltransferase